MKKWLSFVVLLFSVNAFSQSTSIEKVQAQADEQELMNICQKLYHPANRTKQTDSEKKELNSRLVKKFDSILELTNSFENYSFDSLKRTLEF
ncbi:MAG: hypothetical protein IPP64_08610 [Bacteroidetes bacterium]|nr:hypothetical protein [Bacteroidota bacterium]